MRLPFSIPVLIVTFFVTSYQAAAGTWYRTNTDTVTFRGNIVTGEFERFKKVFDNQVKNLIVTSAGGSVEDAIQIAEVLVNHNIKIIVKIWCTSSCANYFFTAAETKVIDKGIVGFHGNATACFLKEYQSSDIGQKLREKYQGFGLTEQQLERSIELSIQAMQDLSRRELAFLAKAGVDPKLFERTCKPDKGMNDGKGYTFLLPTMSTFNKYGIFNVHGSQDQETIEWFNGDLIVN
jgi:hypothetical protein